MPPPKKKRVIDFSPLATYFKPSGIPLRELDDVVLAHEELEALRLQILLEKSQDAAAKEMNISQPTFYRLVNAARKKIVDALVNSKAIKIEGGQYSMKEEKVISTDTVIAISSSSNDLEGEVDGRFGRCQYFVLVSIENGKIVSFEPIKNIKSDMRGGVGTAVAQMVAEHGAKSVITGNIGPRAIDVLRQFDISVYHASGLKRDVISDLINGRCRLL